MSEVFWIEGTPAAPLAVVLRPHGDKWLEGELLQMKREGIQTLVSLLEEDEAEMLGLSKEGPLAEKIGMRFISYPIPDVHIPQHPDSFRTFVQELATYLRAGQRVGVHCRGSIGRATVTAACALIHLGWSPKAALSAIESARGCSVPDTEEQRQWILNYNPKP